MQSNDTPSSPDALKVTDYGALKDKFVGNTSEGSTSTGSFLNLRDRTAQPSEKRITQVSLMLRELFEDAYSHMSPLTADDYRWRSPAISKMANIFSNITGVVLWDIHHVNEQKHAMTVLFWALVAETSFESGDVDSAHAIIAALTYDADTKNKLPEGKTKKLIDHLVQKLSALEAAGDKLETNYENYAVGKKVILPFGKMKNIFDSTVAKLEHANSDLEQVVKRNSLNLNAQSIDLIATFLKSYETEKLVVKIINKMIKEKNKQEEPSKSTLNLQDELKQRVLAMATKNKINLKDSEVLDLVFRLHNRNNYEAQIYNLRAMMNAEIKKYQPDEKKKSLPEAHARYTQFSRPSDALDDLKKQIDARKVSKKIQLIPDKIRELQKHLKDTNNYYPAGFEALLKKLKENANLQDGKTANEFINTCYEFINAIDKANDDKNLPATNAGNAKDVLRYEVLTIAERYRDIVLAAEPPRSSVQANDRPNP